MLSIGLTGGIGSGKSAASSCFADLGAVLIDSDRLAREVVEPGTDGLAAVEAAFGAEVIDADGRLNRPALAALVFSDADALATLNGIVHPRVRAASQHKVAAAAHGSVIVHDIPLLTENGLAPSFALVVVVHTDPELRIERLTSARNMDAKDVAARIAAQASDEDRRTIADVVLDNNGPPARLTDQIGDLWHSRLEPFAANVVAGVPAQRQQAGTWDDAALTRTANRVRFAVSAIAAAQVEAAEGLIEAWLSRPESLDQAAATLKPYGWLPAEAPGAAPDHAGGVELTMGSADPAETATVTLRVRA